MLPQALRFPSRVKMFGNNLEEDPVFGEGFLIHPIVKKGLSIWPGLAVRVLPVHLPFAFGEELAFRHNGTSVGVDGASSDLAVCVLRNPVAGVAFGSISPGSDRRFTHALRTGDECPGNGQQCRVDARGRNATDGTPCEPDVAGCDGANAIAPTGRPGRARTV